MERQRRAVQEAQAQAVLAAALTCLAHRAGPAVCRDLPLTPGTWARPSLKAMQAALYLLYHRIRGAARAKKASMAAARHYLLAAAVSCPL